MKLSTAVAQAASLQSGEFQTKRRKRCRTLKRGGVSGCSGPATASRSCDAWNMESNLALKSSGIVSAGPWSTSKNRYMSDAKGTDLHSKLSSWSILWRRVGTLPRQLQTSRSARTLTEPPTSFDNCFSMQMSSWLDESCWSTIALYSGPHPGSRHGTDEQLVKA